MTIKSLYISDLDGTLLNSDKEISDYTKNTLNVLIENGVHFSVATARTAASAVRILSGVNINIPVVLMNGVVIYDIRRDKYIKTEAISVQSANDIINVLKKHNTTGFMYAVSDNRLVTFYESLDTTALQDFYNERMMKYYKSFVQTDTFLNKITDSKIIYFTLIDEQESLSTIFNAIKKLPDIDAVLYKDIYAQNLWYLEIHSKNASKYNAVKFIRDYCGFDRIIGFGDNLNDIPLFRACDECYAVSNAVEQLKEKASGIIDCNNSDGVARFISEREDSFYDFYEKHILQV